MLLNFYEWLNFVGPFSIMENFSTEFILLILKTIVTISLF